MTTYNYVLTDTAKNVTWLEWLKLGGCGISNYAEPRVARVLGVLSKTNPTLGQIQDAFIVAGRELARFAKTHLGKPDWAVAEYAFYPARPSENGKPAVKAIGILCEGVR